MYISPAHTCTPALTRSCWI